MVKFLHMIMIMIMSVYRVLLKGTGAQNKKITEIVVTALDPSQNTKSAQWNHHYPFHILFSYSTRPLQ